MMRNIADHHHGAPQTTYLAETGEQCHIALRFGHKLSTGAKGIDTNRKHISCAATETTNDIGSGKKVGRHNDQPDDVDRLRGGARIVPPPFGVNRFSLRNIPVFFLVVFRMTRITCTAGVVCKIAVGATRST